MEKTVFSSILILQTPWITWCDFLSAGSTGSNTWSSRSFQSPSSPFSRMFPREVGLSDLLSSLPKNPLTSWDISGDSISHVWGRRVKWSKIVARTALTFWCASSCTWLPCFVISLQCTTGALLSVQPHAMQNLLSGLALQHQGWTHWQPLPWVSGICC